MKKMITLFAGLMMTLTLTGNSAWAQDTKKEPVCGRYNESSGIEGKKLSVIMPKVPGMEASSYNDIGCAVRARNEECATRQGMFDSNAKAHDYLTGEEIGVEKSFFVLTKDLRTPAGYGVVAFKEQAQADAFAAEHGKAKVVKWYQIVDEKLK